MICMKKTENLYKIYNSLSKHESTLLNAMEPLLIFSVKTVKRRTKWNESTIRNTLFSLKKKGIIQSLKKDNYVLTDRIPENLLKIAAVVTAPSYISFWTACSYYGWTEQQIKTVQVVSTKQFPKIDLSPYGTIETTTTNPKRMFGYANINTIPMAEKERVIVDILYNPEKCGGIHEVRKCIKNAWKEVDKKKLLAYLKRFGNKALFVRLGYLLDEFHIRNDLETIFLKNMPKGYTLFHKKEKGVGQYNHKWRIISYDK